MTTVLYSFCATCNSDVDREECDRVSNNYACPECGEMLGADSFVDRNHDIAYMGGRENIIRMAKNHSEDIGSAQLASNVYSLNIINALLSLLDDKEVKDEI